MTQYLRAFRQDSEEEAGPLVFVASTSGVKRDGKDLDQTRWALDAFRASPVVLWAHDYRGERPPIGKAEVEVRDGRLMADVTFDQGDPFAVDIERKYRGGFLNAVSVGWEEHGDGDELRYELLDISAVPVPGDPDALMERQQAGLRSLRRDIDALLSEEPGRKPGLQSDDNGDYLSGEDRGAIAPHSTAKADEGAAWDASAELKQVEGKAELRAMHAWVNDEGDADAKASYKLPHHNAEGKVVWRGVAAAMSRLLQAGTQIPDADRRGVYNHLARHYGQFDKEAPEFRTADEVAALGPDEVRGLFLEGEAELWPALFVANRGKFRLDGRDIVRQAADNLLGILGLTMPADEGDDEQEPEPEDMMAALEAISEMLQEVAK